MKKTLHNPKQLFDPKFFTHVVSVSDARLVFISGQVSYDSDGVVLGKGDIRVQSVRVFQALELCLRSSGAAWSDVVKMNGYMVGVNAKSLSAYREIRSRYLAADQLPASTLVGVERLAHEDLLLEVEMVAAVAEKRVPRKKAGR
jgi:enamine deaminase RidA (YjgF/YER057c/UK114 family)